jgi:lactate permease
VAEDGLTPMNWQQTYTPIGNQAMSGAIGALPILALFALLASGRVRAYVAAAGGLLVALAVAVFPFGLPPRLAGAAALYGAAFGLFPIGWLVLNVIFLFDLSVASGQFAVLKRQISSLSADRRIQVLLIAFGFGAFIEGAAGFGAPVAITGALLAGLGFGGREAAKLALIGNTAPVAFGSVGIPLITLAKVTGLDLRELSAMVGTQLPLFALLIPFWLVAVVDGKKGLREVWPACLVMGGVFAGVQFWVSHAQGPWLVDLASALASIAALLILLRFWQPSGAAKEPPAEGTEGRATRGAQLHPWLPWIFLSFVVFAWSLAGVRAWLDRVAGWKVAMPALHLAISRMPPLVALPTPEPAEIALNLGSATGTAVLLAALATGICLRLTPLAMLRAYGRTLLKLREALLTIAVMMAVGFTTRYAGADAAMGLALAATGAFFPFFSPLIGWLGAALTGSDTSSNVLFGNVQQVAAGHLGISPVITAAANSSGGVMGKMIDAQSIVVASTATTAVAGDKPPPVGEAGQILRSVFWHSLALATLVGIFVFVQALLARP